LWLAAQQYQRPQTRLLLPPVRSIDIQDLDALNVTLLNEIAAMRVAGSWMMKHID